jgi:hypothetical protein
MVNIYNIILHPNFKKKKLLTFQHEIFYVDPRIHIKMNRLKTIAIWIPLILQLKNLHNFHVIT